MHLGHIVTSVLDYNEDIEDKCAAFIELANYII